MSRPKSVNPSSEYRAAVKVAEVLTAHGYEAYIIGGAVRDLWLGNEPKDFDIVTNATPEQVLALNEFKSSFYKDTAQAFGVSRVVIEIPERDRSRLVEVEIATYRRDIEAHLGRKATKVEYAHLKDDVLRRDFTVNALALDPLTDQLIDYVDGLADLEQKIIRFIGRPAERIREDPLRLLRGIRFRNQLGFSYDPQTETAIKAAVDKGQLADIPPERVGDELSKMLVHPSRADGLSDLEKLGALEKLLPEVAATKGVAQPPQFHSEGDVWQHTLLAMSCLPDQVSRRLTWATLLHDVGKPSTYQPAELTHDRIRFSNHYEVGARIAAAILKRLRFGQRFITDVSWMVHYHIGIDDLPKMRPNRQTVMLAHPAFGDLFELHKADARASKRLLADGQADKSQPDFPEIEQLWQNFKAAGRTKAPSLKDIGVDGQWLISELGFKPSPKLGKALETLNEAFLDGKIKNQKEAAEFLKRS